MSGAALKPEDNDDNPEEHTEPLEESGYSQFEDPASMHSIYTILMNNMISQAPLLGL